MKRYLTLVLADLKNIKGDFLLLVAIGAPLLLALLFRFAIPWLTEFLQQKLEFDLTEYYLLIMSLATFITPAMLGMLTGFIILEDRDEQMIGYFAITPLTKSGYLLYRIISPVVSSIVMTFVVFKIAQLVDWSWLALTPIVMVAALEAPMMTLFLGAFAENKVEGLAYAKVSGALFVAPIIGYFVSSNWQYLGGLIPPYWVAKAYWASYESGSGYWIYLLLGLLVHVVYVQLLLKKFVAKSE